MNNPSISCCRLCANPQQLNNIKAKQRWMTICMEIFQAIVKGHSDCLHVLLTLHGDYSILRGPAGQTILQRALGMGCEEFDDCAKALKTMLKFGAGFDYVLALEVTPTFDPISIAMSHHNEEILAILLQKAGAGLSQQDSKNFHIRVVQSAIRTVNIGVFTKLVEAGTDKQELLRTIAEKVKNQSDAQQLRSILQQPMSLEGQSRIAVWSSLSSLEDVTKLRLPMQTVRWLLFEDAQTGYAVSEKLTAGNEFYHSS